ncbi:hypothetical protein A2997_01135 [Candidatus Nomurabacteria bacterium RIFCSPLOWO2_01_FULL_36_10b]|uniref:Cell shape-determining protein MreC n=1 Tax=Candidatus Nomurabacteria bacterium RIFCSPLOWO2_01_FULL_36_10b TaxID=1801766 RepID=A0A1F6WQE6_9BACT|nr:MAG: hypothetical protein A2997_01135 [Candidatus Nomurabacteria bacterium RIFCSPLOWO2_01_FULL_36_10b]
MNMTNFHHAKQSSSYTSTILIIGVLIIAVLLLAPLLTGPVSRIDETVWQTRYKIIDTANTIFKSKKEMQRSLNEINERIKVLEAEQSSHIQIATDIARSGALFGLSDSTPTGYEIMPKSIALVTSRPPQIPYDSLILDRGSYDGVIVGDRVFASNKIILGVVTKSMATTSHVVLYSAPSNEIVGYHSPSQSVITLYGRGGGSFKTEVSQQMEISVGDIITDQSSSRNIIAVVVSIVSDPRDPSQKIYARVPVSLSSLRYVQISK